MENPLYRIKDERQLWLILLFIFFQNFLNDVEGLCSSHCFLLPYFSLFFPLENSLLTAINRELRFTDATYNNGSSSEDLHTYTYYMTDTLSSITTWWGRYSIIPILWIGRQRHRGELIQVHTVSKWQNQEANPGHLVPTSNVFDGIGSDQNLALALVFAPNLPCGFGFDGGAARLPPHAISGILDLLCNYKGCHHNSSA